MRKYVDREEAGRALANSIGAVGGNVIVLGMPRGGVPVAAQVAAALGAPLDVLVVRKLGVPGREELAMGAVAARGVRVLNHALIQTLGISPVTIDAVTTLERRIVERREKHFRQAMLPLDLKGKTVVLVDDGVATGASARAALQVVRASGAGKVVFAAPVGPADVIDSLDREADRVVVPYQPDPFRAVGAWFENFEEVSEGTVRRILDAARARRVPVEV